MRVAVIGAGVIGLTTAVAIKEIFPQNTVIIFSDSFSPNTTGDGSAGLWGPYALTNTSVEQVVKWSEKTHRWMETFWKSDLAADVGVFLIPVLRLFDDDSEHNDIKKWIHVVYGGTELDEASLKQINDKVKKNFRHGYHFLTFTCEPTKLLLWLMKRFVVMGGQIKRRLINSFQDLKDEHFDVIVNCSGLGASLLVNDRSVVPIRGQVTRVEAPWIYDVILEKDSAGNYIIPNIDSVVLGGTQQIGNYDTSIKNEDSEFIHGGCLRLMPSLKGAKILKQWVGLRPGRSSVRLEAEKLVWSTNNETMIIHNYGHGGSGVTLCWGCALDVVEILRDIQTKNRSHL